MKAMIFAAGLGTRLAPLTDSKPKALAEVQGIPLLELLIHKLTSSGFTDIIINVHHFASQIIDFLKSKEDFGINIRISDEQDVLLDTGGGIQNASWFFDQDHPFLVHNVDVISDLNIEKMLVDHKNSNALATLAVRKRKTSRYLLFNAEKELCGWENQRSGEEIIVKKNRSLTPLAFSGIHIIDPKIFDLITEKGVFSIIKTYLNLAENHAIMAYDHSKDFWLDVGRPENLTEANRNLPSGNKTKA